MTTHHATQIYGFFRYLNKKRMVVVSGLCISQSYTSWFILILKDSNMVKGMKIQGYLKHCSASQNRSFRSVSSCGRHWVQCVSAEQQWFPSICVRWAAVTPCSVWTPRSCDSLLCVAPEQRWPPAFRVCWASVIPCSVIPLSSCVYLQLMSTEHLWLPSVCVLWVAVTPCSVTTEKLLLPALLCRLGSYDSLQFVSAEELGLHAVCVLWAAITTCRVCPLSSCNSLDCVRRPAVSHYTLCS